MKMQQNKIASLLFVLVGAVLFGGCEKYAGDKTDLDFIDIPVFQDRDIAYVPLQPVLDGYQNPTDIIAGYDELLYVVDEGTQEIIALDQSGRELGRITVPGVKTVIQDRALDLIAIGTKDTNIAGVDYELAAIYRVRLQGATGYGVQHGEIVNQIVHPFYFQQNFSSTDAEVDFNSVCIAGTNFFYVTRTGPRNNPQQFGGPEDAVLLFNNTDEFITPVNVTTNIGFFTDYFKKPMGIASYITPPQDFAIPITFDFAFTSISESSSLKVQAIRFEQTAFGSSYEVIDLIAGDTSQADRFLYEPDRFSEPVDITLAGDETGYIWVVDKTRDSVYQFTRQGFEGVQPPAAAASRKHVIASFGGTGTALDQFNGPTAVAYLNKILYVADGGNGRILRYQLTTDFD